jgi:uncharacterized protein
MASRCRRGGKPRRYAATMKNLLTLAALLIGVHAQVWATDGQAQNLPTTPLQAGMHVIRAQIAQTPEQRSTGLMFRKDMPANDGMLFVFEAPAQQCFWMKNTLLPLSIAFIADDGAITNIDEMKPQTLNSHCSTKPVRYVLEMNQGWFAKRGIKAGSKLTDPSGKLFAVR